MRRVVVFLAFLGCSSASTPAEEPSEPVTVTLDGAVAKGPFLLGSSVSVSPVDVGAASERGLASAALTNDQTDEGRVFRTETTSDTGEFSLQLAYQGWALIEGTGFYYNEAIGALSDAQLTLRAFHEIGVEGATVNVNLVTHLTYQRVQALIADGESAADAIAQAESELHVALGIGEAPEKAGADLNILGGDTDANAYLLAVSTVFAQAAKIENANGKGSVDASLQELLNVAAAAFASEGTLPAATIAKLNFARQTVDNAEVMAALGERLQAVGSDAEVPDLDRVIPWSDPPQVTECVAQFGESAPDACKVALCSIGSRAIDAINIMGSAENREGLIACSLDADCWAHAVCANTMCLRADGRGLDDLPHSEGDETVPACTLRLCNIDREIRVARTGVGYSDISTAEQIFDRARGLCN